MRRTRNHPVVMTTRVVLVTLCLVAMATLVAPQCSYPTPTTEKSLNIQSTLELWESLVVIGGIGIFALLIAIVFLIIR